MKGYSVKILADSIGLNGKRITTWELTYPRFVHAELMTHRLFSRNSASSRAIPNEKLRKRIAAEPVEPVYWGRNQKGMQATTELQGWRRAVARRVWLLSRWFNLLFSWLLGSVLDAHKQIANRLLEPHMFITVILTATEFENWFRLRANPAAQPEIKWVAETMQELYQKNLPKCKIDGEWHLPLIHFDDELELGIADLVKVSVARCARVSYLTHDGRRDHKEDIRLYETLLKSGHMSPFEHAAQALPQDDFGWSGNFQGWKQHREDVDPHFTKVGKATP